MTLFANVILFLALLATIGLGWSVLPANVPTGPDRGMYGLVCLMFQIPQALLLTLVMLVCVARSTPWPGFGGGQYPVVLIGQFALFFSAFLCVVWYLEGFRGGDLPWVSRGLIAVPLLLAIAEIVFAFQIMNAERPLGDESARTRLGHAGWIVFASASTVSLITLISVYIATEVSAARTHRLNEESSANAYKIEQAARSTAADLAFTALSPADPLLAWLRFTCGDAPEARIQTALAAIARRPALASEIDALLRVDELNTEAQALTLIDQLPADAVAGTLLAFRAYAERLCQEIAAATADGDRDARRTRLNFADARVTVFTAAARGLHRAGMDVRPELTALRDAVGTPDEDSTRDIIRLVDHHLREFSATGGTP